MVRLTSRFAATVAGSALLLTLAACSDSADQATATAPAEPAIAAGVDAATTASTTASTTALTPAASTPVAASAVTELAQATAPAASAAPVVAPEPEGDVDMAAVLEPGPLKDMALGDETAPVTIVEYMSMTCPHCASFHSDNFKPLVDKYVNTGKVRFILREFPFDPRAAAAIMLARCAPENQFFPMVDVLFQQQRTWAAADDARGALLQISRLAGFTQESFEACLTNQKLLDDVNAVRNKAAEQFGIQSTPTFLINGKRYSGNLSVESMSAIIDPLL